MIARFIPIVIMSVSTFVANELTKKLKAKINEPAIVTARHPYFLMKNDEIGPRWSWKK